MSTYVIAVFPSHDNAKQAVERLENERIANEIVVLNKLRKFEGENQSLKLDGVISGVSESFLGLPVFVNPMTAADIPPQSSSKLVEGQWARYGFSREEALKYQELMDKGKTILAVKAEKNSKKIKDLLGQSGAEKTLDHEF
ncbi:MAG TPA: hypothetical protein VFD33_04080 [Bacillota bacterium]|nr:hypothetical protein [Bacillota bacterium]